MRLSSSISLQAPNIWASACHTRRYMWNRWVVFVRHYSRVSQQQAREPEDWWKNGTAKVWITFWLYEKVLVFGYHRAKCQSFHGKTGFVCFRHDWAVITQRSTATALIRSCRCDDLYRQAESNSESKISVVVFAPVGRFFPFLFFLALAWWLMQSFCIWRSPRSLLSC